MSIYHHHGQNNQLGIGTEVADQRDQSVRGEAADLSLSRLLLQEFGADSCCPYLDLDADFQRVFVRTH